MSRIVFAVAASTVVGLVLFWLLGLDIQDREIAKAYLVGVIAGGVSVVVSRRSRSEDDDGDDSGRIVKEFAQMLARINRAKLARHRPDA